MTSINEPEIRATMFSLQFIEANWITNNLVNAMAERGVDKEYLEEIVREVRSFSANDATLTAEIDTAAQNAVSGDMYALATLRIVMCNEYIKRLRQYLGEANANRDTPIVAESYEGKQVADAAAVVRAVAIDTTMDSSLIGDMRSVVGNIPAQLAGGLSRFWNNSTSWVRTIGPRTLAYASAAAVLTAAVVYGAPYASEYVNSNASPYAAELISRAKGYTGETGATVGNFIANNPGYVQAGLIGTAGLAGAAYGAMSGRGNAQKYQAKLNSAVHAADRSLAEASSRMSASQHLTPGSAVATPAHNYDALLKNANHLEKNVAESAAAIDTLANDPNNRTKELHAEKTVEKVEAAAHALEHAANQAVRASAGLSYNQIIAGAHSPTRRHSSSKTRRRHTTGKKRSPHHTSRRHSTGKKRSPTRRSTTKKRSPTKRR